MRKKYPEIGKRIAEARKAKGLKQIDCLEPLGDITVQMLSSWENGHSFPSATYLIKIAEFFDISLDYLILGKKKTKETSLFGTYKDLFIHLNALTISGFFSCFEGFDQETYQPTLSLLSTNKIVLSYYSDMKRLREASDLLGFETFCEKTDELLNKYDYEISIDDCD